jgi:sulfide:quinone oxidoreductase
MSDRFRRPDGLPPRVIVAGGGVAALETLLALRATAAERVELTLLAPTPVFTYRPLAVVEPFARGGVPTLPLAEVAAEHDARLVAGALASVDPDAQVATTRGGERLAYDELVIAVGARAEPIVPGAIPFGGPQDTAAVASVVDGVRNGSVRRVALIAPAGVAWTLPLYELAMQLAGERDPQGRAPELLLITAEHEPLSALGHESAASARELLGARGVQLRTASSVEAIENGTLWIELQGGVEVDAAIALPRLLGPAIDGLPHDDQGFILVDAFCRVRGEEHVYCAGDAAAHHLKQGGLAAQQADTVAACIAHELGAGPRPPSPEPVLRTILLTGGTPRFLRAPVGRGGEEHDGDQVAEEALWWPPAKLAARHLAPYLAERLLREPAR